MPYDCEERQARQSCSDWVSIGTAQTHRPIIILKIFLTGSILV